MSLIRDTAVAALHLLFSDSSNGLTVLVWRNPWVSSSTLRPRCELHRLKEGPFSLTIMIAGLLCVSWVLQSPWVEEWWVPDARWGFALSIMYMNRSDDLDYRSRQRSDNCFSFLEQDAAGQIMILEQYKFARSRLNRSQLIGRYGSSRNRLVKEYVLRLIWSSRARQVRWVKISYNL